jgi:hypothetical protein
MGNVVVVRGKLADPRHVELEESVTARPACGNDLG